MPTEGGREPTKRPSYYKFCRELYETASGLPQAQAGKLCYAALMLFFEGREPDNLPQRVDDILDGWRGRIGLSYQKSVEALEKDARKRSEYPDETQAETQRNLDKSKCSKKLQAGETAGITAQPLLTDRRLENKRIEIDENENTGAVFHSTVLTQPCNVAAPPQFVPPTVDEVEAEFVALGCFAPSSNAEAFIDYNESKGWMIGSTPITDWEPLAKRWVERQDYYD